MSPPRAPEVSSPLQSLPGLLVTGLLLSFTGAILPAWGYHVRSHFGAVGNYFFCIEAGLLLSIRTAPPILRSRGIAFLLTVGCLAGFASLAALSLASPPVAEGWRLLPFVGIGIAIGLLNIGVFHGVTDKYRQSPAMTVNLAGTLFGIGSLLAVTLIGLSFTTYTPGSILLLVSSVPGLCAIWFARRRFVLAQGIDGRPFRELLRESARPKALLFSAILFLQFGNEWALAGWLPIFLIQRLGLSPSAAIRILALFWLALVFGRLTTQILLRFVRHGRLLLLSVSASVFGSIILALTDNHFGAVFAVLLLGGGFAPVYPLVVEEIGMRFPHYHPGFSNGVFSLALTGGMLAPAVLGYSAELVGLGAVVALPLFGSMLVFFLLTVAWMGDRLLAGQQNAR